MKVDSQIPWRGACIDTVILQDLMFIVFSRSNFLQPNDDPEVQKINLRKSALASKGKQFQTTYSLLDRPVDAL